MITITPKDALKAKVLPPGWQIVKVENHYTKPAQADGSTVHYYEMTIIAGQFNGVPLQEFTLSEKAIGMGKNFFIACGQPAEQWDRAEKGESITFDEKLPVGAIVKTMVTPEKFGNRTLNKATDFLSLTEVEKGQFAAA